MVAPAEQFLPDHYNTKTKIVLAFCNLQKDTCSIPSVMEFLMYQLHECDIAPQGLSLWLRNPCLIASALLADVNTYRKQQPKP
jgi:hypothetical protein